MTRFFAVLRKELRQMRRDTVTLVIMFLLPLCQLLLFGFAIHTDVKHQATAVFDQSLSEESRDLIAAFAASEYFDIRYAAGSYEEVDRLISEGRARAGLIIPPDLAEDLRRGRSVPIQVLVDASDSTSSSSAIAAAEGIGRQKSQELLLARHPQLRAGGLAPYDIRIRAWYNRDAVTVYYMLPAITGMILTMTMVMVTSMAIVRERERGTIEQLLVTPLRPWELLLGKIVPYIFIGYIQLTVAILVGLAVFGVPLRGSLLLLYGLSSLFLLASLTLGLLISTAARSQMQAMMMSFACFLPSVLLSGFLFPRDAMPLFFQAVAALFPMTYYVDIIRGILLKGCGLSALLPQTAALLLYATAAFGLAVKKFSRIAG